MPSSPRLPPNMRRHSSNGQPATASPTSRWTATTWWRRRPSWRTSSTAARDGRGPAVVEATTYRWHGHYEGDPERYRSAGGGRGVARARSAARARGRAAAGRRRRRPDQGARGVDGRGCSTAPSRRPAGWPRPAPATLTRLRRAAPAGAPGAGPAGRRRARVPHHGRHPLRPRDRAGRRTTGSSSPASTSAPAATSSGSRGGWPTRFGGRVRDTPISETAIMGLGVGAAMAGMRPVVELMYLDFIGVCFDQLLNQAAKLPVHDRGRGRDGADGADPVRRRPLVGQPALAEPRGAAGAHPGADRGHALDAGRHLRAAAGRPSRTPIRWCSSRTACSTA